MSVGIAGFDRVGLEYAAALGALIADPELGLEIMGSITPCVADGARALVDEGRVTVTVARDEGALFVRAQVATDAGEGTSVIRVSHTNIVLTQANGTALYRKEVGGEASSSAGEALIEKLESMRVSQIRALASSASEVELAFMTDGVEMNEEIAAYGLANDPGAGISGALQSGLRERLLGSGLAARVTLQVAAATEARLEGCPRATMSSAGSGSKGIAVTLPVAQVARALGSDRETTVRALAFAHLMNEYINARIGKLSAICACATASSTAASAAITWLLGGTDEQIGWAIRNMTGTITGMICDGGKVGCALKLSAATSAALTSALLAVNGVSLRATDGVCAETPEDCIRNIARISSPGMSETDHEILSIMREKAGV
jgi:L-cysteine desulfidase